MYVPFTSTDTTFSINVVEPCSTVSVYLHYDIRTFDNKEDAEKFLEKFMERIGYIPYTDFLETT